MCPSRRRFTPRWCLEPRGAAGRGVAADENTNRTVFVVMAAALWGQFVRAWESRFSTGGCAAHGRAVPPSPSHATPRHAVRIPKLRGNRGESLIRRKSWGRVCARPRLRRRSCSNFDVELERDEMGGGGGEGRVAGREGLVGDSGGFVVCGTFSAGRGGGEGLNTRMEQKWKGGGGDDRGFGKPEERERLGTAASLRGRERDGRRPCPCRWSVLHCLAQYSPSITVCRPGRGAGRGRAGPRKGFGGRVGP